MSLTDSDKILEVIAGYVFAKDSAERRLKSNRRDRDELWRVGPGDRTFEQQERLTVLNVEIEILESIMGWLTVGEG